MKDLHYRVSKSFLHLTKKQVEALDMQSPELLAKIRSLEETLNQAYACQDRVGLIQASKEIIALGESVLKGNIKQSVLG